VGEPVTTPRVDGLSVTVVETSNDDAEFDVSWSVSDADDALSQVDLVLGQVGGGRMEDDVQLSVSGGSASGTTRLVAAGDDESDWEYVVDLFVTDDVGNEARDSVTVTEGEPSPSIDELSVAEIETANPDAEFDVAWSVSDPDANLSELSLVLQDDTADAEETSKTVTIDGGASSGTTRLVAAGDDGSGHGYVVDVEAFDVAGNAAFEYAEVTESEPTDSSTYSGAEGAGWTAEAAEDTQASETEWAFDPADDVAWAEIQFDDGSGWAGYDMTDNGDGTFSYVQPSITESGESIQVRFVTGLYVTDGVTHS
jgi:hypothetical protein